MSNVLIFVEQASGEVKKASLSAITFGQQLCAKSGGDLFFVVMGAGANAAAEQVKSFGAAKVFATENPSFEHYLAESYTQAVANAASMCDAKTIAGSTSSTTKDFLPRLASKLGAAMASDVMEVIDAKQFKRPMWAGNVVATVELTTDVQVATVRATEFDEPTAGGDASVETLDVSVELDALHSKFVSLKEIKSERPDATVADVVVAGGRGVKGPEGFKLIEELADLLEGGIGASRAVCDAGWVPNDLQIGQTGKVVAPDLYFAIGISGAIQHLAGMKGSKTIVAINKDPDAPIFQVSDYGLVADLFEAVPELVSSIK